MYTIKTGTQDDITIILVRSKKTNQEYIYLKKEIDFIPDPVLRKYLQRRMHFIESGAYE